MYRAIYYNRKHNMFCIWDDAEGVIVEEFQPYAYEPSVTGEYTSIYGDRMRKIDNSGGRFDGLYEADVPPEIRVLIDKYYESDLPSTGHIVMTIDIEVEMETGMPSTSAAKNAITAIALHDSVSDAYTVFILDPTGEIESVSGSGKNIVSCSDERTLLGLFLKEYESIQPTIITGWNIDDFDIPYLYNRLKRLFGEETARTLSPIQEVRYNQRRERYQIAGVNCLDYIRLYKKFEFGELPSYRLDYVSRYELGRGKVSYQEHYANLDEFRHADIEGFINYNLTDVELVVALDNKKKYIDLAIGVSHIGHIPYEDVFMDSRIIDGAILTYLKRNGLVAPNKPTSEDDENIRFEGAWVKHPIPGRYTNIFDLDLTSLYPSIIMSLNISPETKIAKVESGWNETAFLQRRADWNVVVSGQETTMQGLRQFLEDNNLAISAHGVIYTQEKKGIVPTILDDWFNKRVEYRAKEKEYAESGDNAQYLFFKQRQTIQKVLLNSVYGVLGLKVFRYYDLDNAQSVTVSGQRVITRTAQLANSYYNKIVGRHYTLYFDNGTERYSYENERLTLADNSTKCVSELSIGDKVHKHGTIVDISLVDVERHNSKNINLVSSEERPDKYFRKLHESLYDYNIYIDTDSLFMSAMPIIRVRHPDWESFDEETLISTVYGITTELQTYINESYDVLAKRFFNLDKHRFQIKQENIAKTGFWVKKKRYAQHLIAENGVKKDKIDIKGLDIVRSSFPVAFQKFMRELLSMILHNVDKTTIDEKILTFRTSVLDGSTIEDISVEDIAKTSSVNKLDYYTKLSKGNGIAYFAKGATAQVKAAIAYNRLLEHYKCSSIYTPIQNGSKTSFVYLQSNPFGLSQVSIKCDGTDPNDIMQFIRQYVDKRKMLMSELDNKVEAFYHALSWELPSEGKAVLSEFFSF